MRLLFFPIEYLLVISLSLISDGTISLQELATFIFPESETDDAGEHEPGIIFDFARKVVCKEFIPVS
jgi:hypothetical protein